MSATRLVNMASLPCKQGPQRLLLGSLVLALGQCDYASTDDRILTSLRMTVREFNVFRWAGRMLLDAAGVRRHSRLRERFAFPLRVHGTRRRREVRAS